MKGQGNKVKEASLKSVFTKFVVSLPAVDYVLRIGGRTYSFSLLKKSCSALLRLLDRSSLLALIYDP